MDSVKNPKFRQLMLHGVDSVAQDTQAPFRE
jgi:hypothetical protein